LPFFLLLLKQSFISNDNFVAIKNYLNFSSIRFFLFLILVILFYQMIAGIRHLFMDLGYFETKYSGALSSKFVIILIAIFSLFFGVFLW
jgi:succinate dehydrogenase / fumarate reductase cytochrome b subunit